MFWNAYKESEEQCLFFAEYDMIVPHEHHDHMENKMQELEERSIKQEEMLGQIIEMLREQNKPHPATLKHDE